MSRSAVHRSLLALALVLGGPLSHAAHAGTGRLLSKWMNRAPAVDGRLTTGDWDDAEFGQLAPGLMVAFGNDARTLYLLVLDGGNTAVGPGDFVVVHFDDEGGSGLMHDDGAWLNSGCQMNPATGEGNLLFAADGTVSYQEMVAPSTGCSPLAIPGRTSFVADDSAQGSVFEIAIPLDGPAPLRLQRGERFGLRLQVYRNGVAVGCLPECSAAPLPADYQNFILASIGCNGGVLSLDTGLPLDWTPHHPYAGPGGWAASGPSGDPVFCDQPEQGPGGSAACVSDYDYPSPMLESYLDAPIAVIGYTTASIRFLGTLVQGDPSAFLSLLTWSGNAFRDSPLVWQQNHGAESVAVNLALDQPPYGDGFEPDRISWYHSPWVAGGFEGGYAQVDDFELRCGPTLFLDDFESGLATHWSVTAP